MGIADLTEWNEKGLERLRYEYPLNPGELVLDLGSYRREFSGEMVRRYGVRVNCFDPLDGNAAWKWDGKIEMGGMFYYTSMLDKHNVKEFDCVDIAPYIKDVALMKINIEGGEYELLDYILSKDLLKEVKYLQVQFHLVKDCEEKYKDLAERISLTHKIQWRYPFIWESWERI